MNGEISVTEAAILDALREGPASVQTITERIRAKKPTIRVRVAIAFSLYVVVRKLVSVGFVECTMTPPTPERGRRPGYLYRLAGTGAQDVSSSAPSDAQGKGRSS